jgi:hypothetical protein
MWFVAAVAAAAALGSTGCREDPAGPGGLGQADLSVSATQDLAAASAGDLARSGDLRPAADLLITIPNPPAMPNTDSYCLSRWTSKTDATGIQVVVRVDEYRGVRTGRNGPHEYIHGTIVRTPWLFEAGTIDTTNVEISMNVQTPTDMHGLPMEVPVAAGDYVEVEGEYIPAAYASASTAKGPAAVIHFTHDPCGYAVLNGKKYPQPRVAVPSGDFCRRLAPLHVVCCRSKDSSRVPP